jgi:diacylglycerol kinase (ATP)
VADSEAKGLIRIIKAMGYSWQGLRAAYENEAAFRQELMLSIILIPLAFWLGETGSEIALMVGCVFLVLLVEIINSAIEAVVDRFGGELHDLSGRAKDMGSAAVVIALVNLVVVWGLVVFY